MHSDDQTPRSHFAERLLAQASSRALALLLLLAAVPCHALDAVAVKRQIDGVLDQTYPQLEALYRAVHQHPELGFEETATAQRLAKQMRALGFQVNEGIGRTGLVAIYRNGPGPTVMVRTELDALPMRETTGLAYASRVHLQSKDRDTYVAHSCGHDIHMAVWVGTAKTLLQLRTQWRGTLMFIGQPAEEKGRGAQAMLDDGLFARFGQPDYGFALHVGPDAYGQVSYKSGAVTSNSDTLEVVFEGKGGHGAMPAATIDPVLIAARFVVDVQSVISREKDPYAFGVVSIGAFNAGTAGNVIPDRAQLRGTIRSNDAQVREKLLDGVRRTALASAQMAGAPIPQIALGEHGSRAVINDAALAERTGEVFTQAFGANAQRQREPSAASEDYSSFIAAGVPSFYFSIGGLDPQWLQQARQTGERIPVNHSPDFAPVPQPSIRTGVEAMTLAVMNVMPPAR
ncbi:amidohydrolase [Xanthomonas axonopodis pv. vasculorum]|uniref:Peptidase M20 n=1 Tax=Xanthomonas axonopodis pv. vasculorum TaxID=325777 RepID=A0A098Q6R6_9XANT|nr:amidohydrolase [Xanthomonas axonopodis]KGE53692.1 peptidase M20 [Xanthomonas axonopodis pv. vasculorum]PPV09480.1 amidohydrolase [Xanthomonas axonopodis pv. vasculorum]QKD88312.1 amidohydrolase [Xanthomonas axonopodis pv. vasculorum]